MDQFSMRQEPPPHIPDLIAEYQSIALVLQGGGALGAYQAGVYQALSEAGIEPNWLCGVSIGAINAAIIAGNPPERRLERLRQFWETLADHRLRLQPPEGDLFRHWHNQAASWMTMAMGLPGFFSPRQVNPWAAFTGASGATSFYDTAELETTLDKVIDWDVLNSNDRVLSVGAVNLRTGNFRYFDSRIERIGARHVMASGALPPSFPAIAIDNELYWDGGLVSNTPLQYLLEQHEINDTLAFQVDLFSASGAVPRDMAHVLARQKEIMYSSRTRNNTDSFRRLHNLRLKLHAALKRLPPEALTDADRAELANMDDIPQINVVHLIYQGRVYETQARDYEFSALSMQEHWDSGYQDTKHTLKHRKWLQKPSEAIGMTVHDVHRDDPT